jgi:hypothetical protein
MKNAVIALMFVVAVVAACGQRGNSAQGTGHSGNHQIQHHVAARCGH